MRSFLKPSINIAKSVVVLVLSFLIFSCAGKDTVKTEPSLTSTPPVSSEHKVTDGKTSESVITDINTEQHSDEDEKSKALLSEQDHGFAYKTDYIIGPEDLLEINIYQVDELNRILRVSSSGFIKFPLIGKVKVSGLTASEIEMELGEKLRKYLQEPIVSVYIKEYRSQSITILGAVGKPQATGYRHREFDHRYR